MNQLNHEVTKMFNRAVRLEFSQDIKTVDGKFMMLPMDGGCYLAVNVGDTVVDDVVSIDVKYDYVLYVSGTISKVQPRYTIKVERKQFIKDNMVKQMM